MKVKLLSKTYSALLVFLVVVTVYYVNISAGILSVDDDKLFTWLLNLDGWSLKGLFIGGGHGYYYRPLIVLSYLIDNSLWGLQQSFMHLENILLHAANAILVYFMTVEVIKKTGITAPSAPLVAALLFGLNPLACEPVNWISGRTDVLAGFFLFAGTLLILMGTDRGSKSLTAGGVGAVFTAILAKETALFWFPAGLFLVYCLQRAMNSEQSAGEKSNHNWFPYLMISAIPVAYFVLRHFALRKGDGGISLAATGVVAGEYDLWNKLRVIVKVFGFYFRKLLFPFPLNFAIVSVSNWYVPVGIIVIIFCLYLLYRRNLTGSLLIMSSCLIAPALLVPLGRMAWTPVAERYLYLPAAFFTIAAVTFIYEQMQTRAVSSQAVGIGMALFIAISGIATFQRNLIWQTNAALFGDTVQKSPDFHATKNELARALQLDGRYPEAKSIFLSNVALANEKYWIVSEINRADTMAADNKIEAAIKLLTDMHYTSDKPIYDQYLNALITLYGKLADTRKKFSERRVILLKQIALMEKLNAIKGDPYLDFQIGKLYVVIKDKEHASRFFRRAAESAPPAAFYKIPAEKLARRLGGSADKSLPAGRKEVRP